MPEEFYYYINEMHSTQYPEFENMTYIMLKNLAHTYVFTKTTISDSGFLGKEKYSKYVKKKRTYELNEPLPTKFAEKQRQKYLDYYGYDPIPLTLSKKRMAMALKERWQLYRKLEKQYDGDFKNLQKCPICLSNNVSIECWDALPNKYIQIYMEQTSSTKIDNYTGKPPAKCQKCSLVCCWDCWWKWTNIKESCPQCRTYDPAIIPKLVWSEDTNTYIDYTVKKGNYYHIYKLGWVGNISGRTGYLTFPNKALIDSLEAKLI